MSATAAAPSKLQRKHPELVGNKAKGRMSKRVFQENKERHIFQKADISYPVIHIRGLINVRFSENLACFVFLKPPF